MLIIFCLCRSFNGITNEDSILQEINRLAEDLDSPELFLQDTFIVAGYNNPADPNRRNEIWFIQRPWANSSYLAQTLYNAYFVKMCV